MPRKERERRYISEYLKETFPEGDYQVNVELGPIPQEYVQRMGFKRAAAMFRPTRQRVDAVIWSPDKYVIVEAKLRDMKAGIGDLLLYRSIIPKTLDLPEYTGQPIVARLVIPWKVATLEEIATENDIEVVVFEKEWVAGYVKERQEYHTAESREKRAEVKKLREVLGVD